MTRGLNSAAPGSEQGLYLVVSDIEAARAELAGRGVDVTGVFHQGDEGRLNGPDPSRRSYASFVSFSDPDGNRWLVQEVTARLPGRVDPAGTTYTSARELVAALRRAEAAHGKNEKRTGQRDAAWAVGTPCIWLRSRAGRSCRSKQAGRGRQALSGSPAQRRLSDRCN